MIKNELLFDQKRENCLRIECYVSGNNAENLKPVVARLIQDDISWNIANIGLISSED